MTTQPIDGQPAYAEYSDYAVDFEARDAVETLRSGLRTLSAQNQDATRRLESVHSAALAARRGAADLAGSLRRLAARVEWLEDRLRASGTVPVAELDRADTAVHELARAVLDGRDALEGLLEPDERAALLGTVEAFRGLERDRDRAARDVLAISTVLETTPRTDPAHAEHAARFRDAERRYAQTTRAVAQNSPAARSAQERLDADDEHSVTVEPTMVAGRRAELDLDSVLRERLAQEVERGALMPAWFSAVLGPAPSAAMPTAVWFDAAAAALAYRLVYGVDDATALLGSVPEADESRHRGREYDRIVTELSELDAGSA